MAERNHIEAQSDAENAKAAYNETWEMEHLLDRIETRLRAIDGEQAGDALSRVGGVRDSINSLADGTFQTWSESVEEYHRVDVARVRTYPTGPSPDNKILHVELPEHEQEFTFGLSIEDGDRVEERPTIERVTFYSAEDTSTVCREELSPRAIGTHTGLALREARGVLVESGGPFATELDDWADGLYIPE